MGKGDKRSKRGKIFRGTFGNARPQRRVKVAPPAAVKPAPPAGKKKAPAAAE